MPVEAQSRTMTRLHNQQRTFQDLMASLSDLHAVVAEVGTQLMYENSELREELGKVRSRLSPKPNIGDSLECQSQGLSIDLDIDSVEKDPMDIIEDVQPKVPERNTSSKASGHAIVEVGTCQDADDRSGADQISDSLPKQTSFPKATVPLRVRTSWGTSENLLFGEGTKHAAPLREGDTLRGGPKILERCVLPVGSRPRLAWEICCSALVLYDIVMIPFVQAFNPRTSSIFFTTMALLSLTIWTMDIPRCFFNGHVNRGIIEMRLRMTALRYLKTWFVFDFMVLTVDWLLTMVIMLNNEGFNSEWQVLRSSRWLRALRILRALRLVRCVKMFRTISYLIDSINAEGLRARVHICCNLIAILLVSHILACIWYAVGNNQGFGDRTWVNWKAGDMQSIADRYFTSLHWALAQFTPATVEVFPRNASERLFATSTLIFGFVTFSSFVSNINSKMTQLSNMNHEQFIQEVSMRRFFHDNKVSVDLTDKVRSFLESTEVNRRIFENDIPILKTLPERVRLQMHVEIYMPVLIWHPLLHTLSDIAEERMRAICHTAMSERCLLPEQELFLKGDLASNMFFVLSGSMAYNRKDKTYLLAEGTLVCEAALWLAEWTHRGRMTAFSLASVFCLDAAVFKSVLNTGTDSRHAFHSYVSIYSRAFQMKALACESVLTDIIDMELVRRMAEEALDAVADDTENGGEPVRASIVFNVIASLGQGGDTYLSKAARRFLSIKQPDRNSI